MSDVQRPSDASGRKAVSDRKGSDVLGAKAVPIPMRPVREGVGDHGSGVRTTARAFYGGDQAARSSGLKDLAKRIRAALKSAIGTSHSSFNLTAEVRPGTVDLKIEFLDKDPIREASLTRR